MLLRPPARAPGLAAAALAFALVAACGGSTPSMSLLSDLTSAPADMCPSTGTGAPHKLNVKVQLTDDGMGVPFFTQNGSTVHVKSSDLAGKLVLWVTLKGGDQAGNGTPIDTTDLSTTLASDLSAAFSTPAKYTDGAYELALFVSVTGGDPMKGPQPGDIAAFDLTPPPACQPPVTGTTVRFTIADADASLTLTNRYFIRF